MSVQEVIKSKILSSLSPQYFVVENESHMHSGLATESHFKLTVVATDFEDLSLVKRHQNVYEILADELSGPVHALALHLYTPGEWQTRHGAIPDSPDCRGGSKSE